MLKRPEENFEEGRITNLINFFSCLPKIERLWLVEGYIKVLSAGSIPETLPRSINSLKHLELDGVNFKESGEILFLICLIKSSPNLVELVIKSHSMEEEQPDIVEELDCNRCCLSQLRTVKIEVQTAFERALDIVLFLLANSPSLEILTFKVGLGLKLSDSPLLLSISRDLLQMERASQRAEVNFIYDGLVE